MEAIVFYPELLERILSFVPIRDLLIVSQVSPIFENAAKWSLKRRMILKISRTLPLFNIQYNELLIRDFDSHGHVQQIQHAHAPLQTPEFDSMSITRETDSETLQPEAHLEIRLFETRDLSLIAIQVMNLDWCSKISVLHLTHHLAVEDWNRIGTFVLTKFPALTKLQLKLLWIPDYRSTLKVENIETENASGCKVDEIYMEVLDQVLVDERRTPNRTPLEGAFVVRCSKLKKLFLEYIDRRERPDDLDPGTRRFWRMPPCKHEFNVRYFQEKRQLELDDKRWHEAPTEDGAPSTFRHATSVCSAIAPLLDSLPLSHLIIQESPECLQFLKSAPRIKSIEIFCDFHHSKVTKYIEFFLDFFTNHSFDCMESLQLVLSCVDTPQGYKDYVEFRFKALHDYYQFQLPQIKRLVIIGEEWDLLYGFVKPAHKCPRVFPNVELMIIRAVFGHLANIAFRICHYSGLVLEHSANFKKLRHLVWIWDSVQVGRRSIRYGIKRYLARHEELQSLTVKVDDEDAFKTLKAVIKGCAAAPRMRLLQVFIHADAQVQLQNDKHFRALLSKAKSVTVRFIEFSGYREYDIDYDTFQVSSLDQLVANCGALDTASTL